MPASEPLRVAVVGTGHLGAIHARIYHEIEDTELAYVVDANVEKGREIASRFGAEFVEDYRDILGKVNAASIATPTVTHKAIAKDFLEAGVPVLVEKPITLSVEEAEELVAVAREKGLSLQVGHVERFNPAMLALRDDVRKPLFIEAHRISPFSFRSTDIGVVLDLMIHDLDLILALVDSPVKEIRAVGVNVLSPATEDIANCRLTFESGCVANLTASRISDKVMRKMRFFTSKAYATVDFRTREAYIYRKAENFKNFDPSTIDPSKIGDPLYYVFNKIIDIKKVQIDNEEPLKLELRSFIHAVREKTDPVVTGEHGMAAIRLAYDILGRIRKHLHEQLERRGDDPDFGEAHLEINGPDADVAP